MDSFIIIDGLALWVMLVLFSIIVLSVIYLGCSYINEVREHNETKQELNAVNEDNNCLRCQLSKTQEKVRSLTYKTPEVE